MIALVAFTAVLSGSSQSAMSAAVLADGSKVLYSQDYLSPSNRYIDIWAKNGNHHIELAEYAAKRVKERKPGSKDRTLNDLAYMIGRGGAVYSIQWVAVTRSRVLGLLGYVAAFMSPPHQDRIAELVEIDTAAAKPSIRPIRFVESTGERTPSGPRFLWSNGRLLLRQREGFEVLGLRDGSRLSYLSVPGISTYVGRIDAQTVVFSPNQTFSSSPECTVFDQKRGRQKTWRVRTSIKDPYFQPSLTGQGNIKFYVTGSQAGSPQGRQMSETVVLDSQTGKVLSRTQTVSEY